MTLDFFSWEKCNLNAIMMLKEKIHLPGKLKQKKPPSQEWLVLSKHESFQGPAYETGG